MKFDKEKEKEVWRKLLGVVCPFLHEDKCGVQKGEEAFKEPGFCGLGLVCCYYCEDYKKCANEWVVGKGSSYCKIRKRNAWCAIVLVQYKREIQSDER